MKILKRDPFQSPSRHVHVKMIKFSKRKKNTLQETLMYQILKYDFKTQCPTGPCRGAEFLGHQNYKLLRRR